MAVRICGVGDNVVDRYLELGVMFPGGNALNVAVFARRAGADAAYLGITGSDIPGELIRAALQAEGIETTRVRINQSFNAFSQIGIDPEGNRYFIGSTPPPYRLVLNQQDLDYLAQFTLVHTGDYSQIEEQLELLSCRVPISFDFGSKPDEYAEGLLPFVRVATFSGSELSDKQVLDRITWAQAKGPDTVIVTRGAHGSTVASGPEIHHEPAHPTEVKDSLGAGDSFIATLLVKLNEGYALCEAARAAATTAAEVCTRLGAFGYDAPMSPLPLPASA
jgi:fructoselysine 6-kinase